MNVFIELLARLGDLVPLLEGYQRWVRILVFLYFVGGVTGYFALVLLCRGVYPDWVRILVLLNVVGGVIGYGALVLFAPTAQFTLDDVRTVDRVATGKPLIFDVIARNPTSAKVVVKELILSFHNGKPPSGGLQGFESVSGTYDVSASEKAKGLMVVYVNNRETLGETSVVYPYAGQDFAQLRVPVAQTIEKDGTDRFRVKLSAPDVPKLNQRFLDVVAVYNGNKETELRRVELQ